MPSYLQFAFDRYGFNRFAEEVYLYDRLARDYSVLEGLLADVVHLVVPRGCTIAELESRVNSLISPSRVSSLSLGKVVTFLCELGVLTEGDRASEWSALPAGTDPLQHVKDTRDLPFFFTPLAANLFINGKCNQKCSFCFLDFELMERAHHEGLSREEWFELTDRLIDAGVVIFNIGGMEPLLSFDLALGILERADSAGCAVGMITNGSIPIPEDGLERLASMACKVGISLEYHLEAIHNRVADLPHAFQHCVANVKKLVAAGVPVGIQAVALRENTRDIEGFMKWIDGDLQVESFTLQNVFGGPWCSQVGLFDVAMNPAEYRNILDRVEATARVVNMAVEVDAFPHERPNGYYSGRHRGSAFRAFSTCSAGKTAIQISPTGDLSPCPFTVGRTDWTIGNVLQERPLGLWHLTDAFGPFRKWLRDDYASTACKNCEAFDTCRGGCLITAEWANGGFLNGDPRCSKVSNALEHSSVDLAEPGRSVVWGYGMESRAPGADLPANLVRPDQYGGRGRRRLPIVDVTNSTNS